MRTKVRTPDAVIRPAAIAFLAVVAEHPADVLRGQAQIVDLAAVLEGHQAPSIARKTTARRGRRAPMMDLDTATSHVMSYSDARPGSRVEEALNRLRDTVLQWTPAGYVPTVRHSAPPPIYRSYFT